MARYIELEWESREIAHAADERTRLIAYRAYEPDPLRDRVFEFAEPLRAEIDRAEQELARLRLDHCNALSELCYRLVESVKDLSAMFVPPSDAVISQTPQAVNLAWFKIPIHPAVGRYFKLVLYPGMHAPSYSVRNAPAMYAEYCPCDDGECH